MQAAYVLCEGRPENSITSWKNAPRAPQPLQILNYTLQIGKYRLRCEEISKQLILGQKFLGAANFREPSFYTFCYLHIFPSVLAMGVMKACA